MKQFSETLTSLQKRVAAALDLHLPAASILPKTLHEAMRYSCLNGGKRIRAALVYLAGEAVGGKLENLDGPAAAVECLHAYSLIHDDLPAMDDDEIRRGQPTCHVKYGEATAILAGDALHDLAYEILATDQSMAVNGEIRTRMIALLSMGAGSRGMTGGQQIDLSATGGELTLPELENMHIHKTGALIRTSTLLGLLGGGARDEKTMASVDHFAKCIGLAFQIQDDVLDATTDTETLGKPSGADKRLNKPTYVSLLGLEQARTEAKMLYDEALESLSVLGDNGAKLRDLAHYIVDRKH